MQNRIRKTLAVLATGAVPQALIASNMCDRRTPSGVAFAASTNSGSATAEVGFSDLSQLKGDDYLLRNTSSGWQITRARSGETMSFTGTGSGADPFIVEGVSITLSGTAAVGDSFRISPTHDTAGEVRLLAQRGFETAQRYAHPDQRQAVLNVSRIAHLRHAELLAQGGSQRCANFVGQRRRPALVFVHGKQVHAAQPHRALRGCVQSCHDGQQGAFARARSAHNGQ